MNYSKDWKTEENDKMELIQNWDDLTRKQKDYTTKNTLNGCFCQQQDQQPEHKFWEKRKRQEAHTPQATSKIMVIHLLGICTFPENQKLSCLNTRTTTIGKY